MEKLLMQLLSRASGWCIGIHTGKRNYYYLVGSKSGKKYRPWIGIVTYFTIMFLMYVTLVSFLGIASVPAEYGFKYWPVSVGLTGLAVLSGWTVVKLINAFEQRPEFYDEDYEPTEEELADWDNWIH